MRSSSARRCESCPTANLDDAIERANATHFGLSGSCGVLSFERATAVAAKLECGTAGSTTTWRSPAHQPFGGFKWSGIGVENGPWGVAEFTENQVLYRSKVANGLDPATERLPS